MCINRKAYKNCKQDFIKETDLERTFVALMSEIMVDKQGFIETVISNIEAVVRKRAEANKNDNRRVNNIYNTLSRLRKAVVGIFFQPKH